MTDSKNASNRGSKGNSSGPLSSNIFVLGDLLIDHTVFVDAADPAFPQPVSGESSFEVRRRVDTAGGAATTARTISVLTSGHTYLWGLTGSSPWGTFRSVLEASQALDRSRSRIEFRGVRDESDAPMTTISRLVEIHEDDGRSKERYIRKARFSDFGQLHIPIDRQLVSIQHHLHRVNVKTPLDAIVLNDLDMGALCAESVHEIGKFAEAQYVPLVVRARRDGARYKAVRAEVLVCTLADWKSLVAPNGRSDAILANLTRGQFAEEFMRLTLAAFPRIRNFAVLVGDDWIDKIVLVERREGTNRSHSLSIIPGVGGVDRNSTQQVGASDVFTGSLAVNHFHRGSRPQLGESIEMARRTASAYQVTTWHHVPHHGEINSSDSLAATAVSRVTQRVIGTPWLPRTSEIDLRTCQCAVPGLVSVDDTTLRAIDGIAGWLRSDEMKSLVLVAGGGSGKSEIAKRATRDVQRAFEIEDLKIAWSWNSPQRLVERIVEKTGATAEGPVLVIVDEATKAPGKKLIPTEGVKLLDAAAKAHVRFLLIDADFAKLPQDSIRSQLKSRVHWYELPSAWRRPWDVPYVLASMLNGVRPWSRNVVKIEATALTSVLEAVVNETKSFRDLRTLAVDVSKGESLDMLTWERLPREWQGPYKPFEATPVQYYSFAVDR